MSGEVCVPPWKWGHASLLKPPTHEPFEDSKTEGTGYEVVWKTEMEWPGEGGVIFSEYEVEGGGKVEAKPDLTFGLT